MRSPGRGEGVRSGSEQTASRLQGACAMRHRRSAARFTTTVASATLAAATLLSLPACRRTTSDSAPGTAPPLTGVAEPMPSEQTTAPMGPSCLLLLAQAECWMRRAGNPPSRIHVALAVIREELEHAAPEGVGYDAVAECEWAMAFRRLAVEQAGCADVASEPADLPASAAPGCAPGEHFFIRRDGWIVGCRRDCVRAQDCEPGRSCSSVGSAPGGPIDEPFCD